MAVEVKSTLWVDDVRNLLESMEKFPRFFPESGASPLLAKPEMGSVRCRVHRIRRRPWPSAVRVRPASVPARTPRGTRTPAMTGRRVAWPGLSSPPALTRRTPTKRTTLRLRGGRRTPLVAYAPSLSWAPPEWILFWNDAEKPGNRGSAGQGVGCAYHCAYSISSFLPQMNANEPKKCSAEVRARPARRTKPSRTRTPKTQDLRRFLSNEIPSW